MTDASPHSSPTGRTADVPIDDPARFRAAQWRMLLATMFCYLFYYTGRQTFGFAIPGVQEELGISKTTLGWASTCLLWSYAFGQAINGNLADQFGGRRIMSAGAAISCALNWVTSFGQNIASLLIPWTLNGYAQSMGWAPGSRVISNWWGHERRGVVYGLYVFAAGMSSVISFITPLLIIGPLGLNWRWIFRLPVLLLLVGGVIYFLVVREHPRDMGFASPSDEPNAADQSDMDAAEGFLERYMVATRNWRFVLASWSIGFQNVARYGLIFWVPVHFLGENWKESPYGWVSVALPVGMALGALTSGWLSDHVFGNQRWPVITIFMLLSAGSSFAMLFIEREQVVLGIVVLFLCGFFVYGPQSSFWALCPDLLGRRHAGTGTGVMNAHAYVFAGLGEPTIGWLMETNQVVGANGTLVDNTALVFPVVAVASLASALIAPFIRR
ncbi:MAG: MFS transporter [Pirellulales bacterium]|nr:MFS transporter [Pirellulales bacterium]